MKNWERGAPDKRTTDRKTIKRRLEDLRAGLYMQTLLRDPAAGVMHSLIYFSFLVLFAVTTVLEINHQLPPDLKFLHGDVYKAYSAVGDAAGVVFLAGVIWAIVRRYGLRPYRIRIKSKPEHAVILGTFLLIGVSGFGAEAFRIALDGTPSFEQWSFVGYPLALAVDGAANLDVWHRVWWVLHVGGFVAFVAILPVTMLRHMFTSPLNMYLRAKERPKGAMRPLPNLMETELETFGASTVSDFTWKQLLDTDACTMCGRCTSVCPAHATGQAARSPRDRAQGGRGDGGHRFAVDVASDRRRLRDRRSPPTRCSSASPPRSCGPARRARPATRSARSTSRSSTRSSTCGATCR